MPICDVAPIMKLAIRDPSGDTRARLPKPASTRIGSGWPRRSTDSNRRSSDAFAGPSEDYGQLFNEVAYIDLRDPLLI